LSVDEQCLYAGDSDGIIREWNLTDGIYDRTFVGYPSFVRTIGIRTSVIAIAISDDGQLFYSGSDDGIIKEWSLIDGSCQSTFKAHQGVMSEMAISANGKMLYTCGKDLTIEEFDVVTGQCLRTIDPRLCAGANITNVKGLTPAQTNALLALGAISDVGWEDVQIDDGCISIDYRPQMNLGLRAKVH
jgi:WD40 repeat protein